MKVLIDDFGTFATAIGIILAEAGHYIIFRIKKFDIPHALLYESLFRTRKNILGKRENNLEMPGVELPQNIEFTDCLDPALEADIIFIAVPSKFLQGNFHALLPYLARNRKSTLVMLTKGIDPERGRPLAENMRNDLNKLIGYHNFAVLSGYTPASALAVSKLTKKYYAASVASSNLNVIKKLHQVFRGSQLGICGTTDVTGVGLGGALKNAYALGYGILLGLGRDDIAYKYLVMAHNEMRVFLKHFNCSEKTLESPAVRGDFFLTSVGEINWESRNVTFGKYLAQYPSTAEILKYASKKTVEGNESIRVLWALAGKNYLYAPLLYCIHSILAFGASPVILLTHFNTRH